MLVVERGLRSLDYSIRLAFFSSLYLIAPTIQVQILNSVLSSLVNVLHFRNAF